MKCNPPHTCWLLAVKTPKLIATRAYPSGGNAQFDSKPSKANRLLGFEQPAAAECNSAAGKPASTKNLNNLLADDGDEGDSDKVPQGEQPGLIQQLLNFFFSKLWSPATSDAEKLGWTYVYAEDGSLLAEYGEGSAATSGSAQYLWLPTANGPMPIAAVVNGQTYAVHSDHLNTPRKLTQANGQAVWQWAYSAFGDEQPTTAAKRFTSEMTNPTTGATSTPEVTFNLRYPGQYFDKETNLHYNYFRTYAPGTGRYTQADPIGLDGGWNRFAYVEGNPLSYTDPEGLVGLYNDGSINVNAYPGEPAGGNEHARHGPGQNYHVHIRDSAGRDVRISTETWRPLTPQDQKLYDQSKSIRNFCEGLSDGEKKFFDRVNRQVFHRGYPTVNQTLRLGGWRGRVGGKSAE